MKMKLYDIVDSGGVYVIAEMSANHAGKLDNALAIVRAAKDSGADCLKIQTYTADTLTLDCDNEFFQIRGGLWDGCKLYDLYTGAYTPWEWHEAIKVECDKVGIDFLSTPFDKTAVDFLIDIGVDFFKIASFELVDIPLIEYTASKGKPMLISCGLGSIEEIQEAIDACKRQGNEQIVLLKCCSEYPAVYSDMNLAVLQDMAERFAVKVGLSDHSMGSIAAIVGVGLGACVIEKHFCLSREIKTADSAFSMEPHEFSALVSDIRTASAAKGTVCYSLSEREKSSIVFRRSLFAAKDIGKGERITEENVRSVRPGYGMKPKYLEDIVGKRAACDIKFGTPLSREMIFCGENEDG